MPPDPTQAMLKRRSSRKDMEEYRFDAGHARELEQKRSRGEVSCAECRRLKIKCDKQIPCQSCQRRGCAALCPNGSLSTGQGTRFVLAATEHLHRRIARLSTRIRQLEDALSALQARNSSEPHPLLHADLVTGDDDDGLGGTAMGGVEEEAGHTPDIIDAFGTLSISDYGISRFFGPTGGSESLLLANLGPSSSPAPSPPSSASTASTASPHTHLSLFSQSFPFTPLGAPPAVQALIASHLPPWHAASALVQTYIEQVSWIFHGITRAQLVDDMLPAIYRHPNPDTAPPPEEGYDGPHDLALLFMVFAIGALVRPSPSPSSTSSTSASASTSPPPTTTSDNSALAEHYHQLARAALALQPVLEKPALVTIQTLHLMSIYNAMSGQDVGSETSMEMTWSLITLAAHLSQTIGLHRDSARWGLAPKMVQRRRILFWDLFVADVWQSLNTGRPPSFSLAYIDCAFPDLESEPFLTWQFRFAAECVADVGARTLTAEAPSYATIMELDKKVREFPLPEGMGVDSMKSKNADGTHKQNSDKARDRSKDREGEGEMAKSFQRCVLDHIRETVLMYIHRAFFAQAILEHPANPLRSAYAPSFLAAYRAAATILGSVGRQYQVWGEACARYWTMWTFAFSAAVVFGTVVTRGPRSPLAQSAMAELEQACVLFSKASIYSIRCTKALPILVKLADKARYALAAAQADPAPLSGAGGHLWNVDIAVKAEDGAEDDELAIFAGHTRFVSAKKAPLAAVAYNRNVQAPTPQQPYITQYEEPRGWSGRSEYVHASGSREENWSGSARGGGYAPAAASASASGSRLREYDLPAPAPGYPEYVPSERTHQLEAYAGGSGSGGGRWENEPQQQSYPPVPMLMQAPRIVPSQYAGQYPPPLPPPVQPQQQQYQQEQYTEYQSYPSPPYAQQPQPQPVFHLPNAGLADLGLAARDSRLDERWSSFMQDSGILEEVEWRGR